MNSPIRASATYPLLVERVESLADLRGLESEWRELEPHLPELPFLTFDWAVAWWEHLAEHRWLVADKLFARAIRDRHGALVAVAPLMITQRPGWGLGARQLQLFGADPNLTEIRRIAAPVELEPQVYAALMHDLSNCSDAWDWLALTGVPANAELRHAVSGSFPRAQWSGALPNYVLPLAETFADFKSGLSRNIKESLRKCYNSLKRDDISFEFRVLTSNDGLSAALDEFFRLHRARSALTNTVHHYDSFGSESSRQFLRSVCERFAARDKLRLFQLKIAGRVVATRIGFVCGSCLYLYYSGYEPEYGRYSIMTTLVAEAVRYAIESGLRSLNLSTGTDNSKLRWGPSEKPYQQALVVSPSPRGGLAHELSTFALKRLGTARHAGSPLAWLTRR